MKPKNYFIEKHRYIELYAESLNTLLTTDKQFYNMKESDLCLYRQARSWSGTTIVSLPAESVRQLEIEEGETLKVEIRKAEGEAVSTE